MQVQSLPKINYDRRRFDYSAIARCWDTLKHCSCIAANPFQRLSELPLLTAAESISYWWSGITPSRITPNMPLSISCLKRRWHETRTPWRFEDQQLDLCAA